MQLSERFLNFVQQQLNGFESEAPIQLNLPGKVTLQSQTLPSAEWTAHLCLLLSHYDQHK